MSNYSYALASPVYGTNPYALPAPTAAPAPASASPLTANEWDEIMYFIEEGDMPNIISFFAKHGGSEVCLRQFSRNRTMLHIAGDCGSVETFRALLEMKADPNLYSMGVKMESFSALQYCLWCDGANNTQEIVPAETIEKIKLLLAHGGDLFNHWPRSESLISELRPPFLTIEAAIGVCNDMVIVLLLEHCVGTWFDPNSEGRVARDARHGDFDVQHALYIAIKRKLKASVEFLVTKLRADPNVRSPITSRWLFVEATSCVFRPSPQVCTALLNAGANPFVKDGMITTPYDHITRCERTVYIAFRDENEQTTLTDTVQVMNEHIKYRLTVLFFRKLRVHPHSSYDGFFRAASKEIVERTRYNGFFHTASKEIVERILGFCPPATATFTPKIVLEK